MTASLGLLLKQHGYASRTARSPEDALSLLERAEFSLVLQDMNFSRDTSGQEGMRLLASIRSSHPQLPVLLITAWGSIALAVEGIKAGAADFVTKPWSNLQLVQAIETALSLAEARTDEREGPVQSRQELDERYEFREIQGNDPRLLRILELVGRVSSTEASVLITGESGTGKELVAEAIHRNSRRSSGPFIKVNLGGISSTLFESEMFGHVKGAFTDARDNRRGRFEIADSGTIFLDEIGELEPASQVKLLRVLQDRSYEVLGSSATRTVDVRVVSATNRDLPQLVADGQFREDLLYRLNLISVHLPPLRERRGDIPLLARHFMERFSEVYRRGPFTCDDRAVAWLESQSWPGNVRQLRQTLERAVLVMEGDRLGLRDLMGLSELEARERRGEELPSAGSMTLDELEKAMIAKCLQHYQGNLTRVSEALGLSRAALYRRLRKFGLEAGRS